MNDSSTTLPFIRLNISPNHIEEQINSKITRITTNPIASENDLNEIRNLVFYIPLTNFESDAKPVAEKIFTVAMQMNQVQSSKEIDNFRHELLSLLVILDFRFTALTPIEKIASFFKYLISEGTISDLTDAVLIIKHTFEVTEGMYPEFLLEITKFTIASFNIRLNWLLQHYDSVDFSYFSPFINMLTVLLFCARKNYDTFRDQYRLIFSAIETFLAKEFPSNVSIYSTIPLLALKSRVIHYYSLSSETIFKNKPIPPSFIDTYMTFFRQCPPCYHSLLDDITRLFIYMTSSKKDPELILKYIEVLPTLVDFTTSDIDYYLFRQASVIKLFEAIIQTSYCKLPIIELMIEFSINGLFVSYFHRLSKFQKIIQVIFLKFQESPPPTFKYHFAILFAIHQFVKSLNFNTRRQIESITKKQNDSTDFQQQIIVISSQLFETIGGIFDCLLLLFDSIADCRFMLDKVVQARSPNLPFSQVEIEYIHQIFINIIFLLIDVRYLSGKCNLRSAAQKITDDPYENSKLCVTHMKLLTCYYEIRKIISKIFQTFPKVLRKSFHPLFLTNLWNRFFNEFFQKSDRAITSLSFIFYLLQDFPTFSSIITCLLQLCIDSINSPKKGSFVIQTASFIFRKINAQSPSGYDLKDKLINTTFLYLQKKVLKVIFVIQNQIESIVNLDEAILFIIELLNLFITFFKSPNKLPEILNPRLVERIIVASNQREVGKPLLSFFEFANLHAPKNIEFQQVIDLLIRCSIDRIAALNLIYLIGKRNKAVVYNDKERMKKLLSLILDVLPTASSSEKVNLLKMMRKLPTSRIININGGFEIQSGMKPTIIYDKYSVPLIDLITATIKSIENSSEHKSSVHENSFSNSNDEKKNLDENNGLDEKVENEVNDDSNKDEKIIDELWDDLENYFECLFGIYNSLQFIKAFQDDFYTQKCMNPFLQLMKNHRNKVLQFAFNFAQKSIDFFSHFTVSMAYSQFILTDSESFKLYSVIETQTQFTQYLQKVITIYHLCYPNLYIILNEISTNIVNNIEKKKIDACTFAIFVSQYVTHRLLPRKPISFTGNRFKFPELEILPIEAQDLVDKTKDLLNNCEQDCSILLEHLADSCVKLTRYTYAEFASCCLNENVIDSFLKQEFDAHYHSNLYHLMKIVSTILRISPHLINKYYDQLDMFVQKEISVQNSTDKEKVQIINELLCSMARASPSTILEKYEKKFFEIICASNEYSSAHVPFVKSIKEWISDSLMSKIRSYFVQKLREDGIETLMTWDTYQAMKLSNLGKWERIIFYWPLAFLFLPSEIAPTTIRQLAESVKSSLEVFYEIVQFLVTEDVICYLASENKYDVLMNVITQAYLNFNLSVGNKEYKLLIDAIAFANDAGIRFLRSAIPSQKKFSFIQIAFETEERSQHLKEVILSDLEFVQSILKPDPKNISINSQLSFAASALSDESIFLNPDLYQLIFEFFMSHLKFDVFDLIYVESFVQFISKNFDKISKIDVLRSIQLFFNANSQIVLSMILDLIKEITKENSNFELNELCELTFTSIEIHYKYIRTILIEYIKNKNSSPGDFLHCIQNSETIPFVLVLKSILLLSCELHDSYQISSDEVFNLYQRCSSIEEKQILYEIWSKSQGETHFEEIFVSFLSSLSIYMSSYQQKTCENIKLPKNCSISLLNPLVKVILAFQKTPTILVSLWAIFSNNLDKISNPLTLLWPMLIRQVLNLKQYPKKSQIALIPSLTKLICSSPPPPNDDNFVIVYFANFVMLSIKMVIETQPQQKSFILPIIESAIELIKRFGGQLTIAKLFLDVVLDIYRNNSKQQQNVFSVLMHFVSKILKYSIMHKMDLTGMIDLEPICDMVFKVTCTVDSPSWPSAYMALNTLLQYGKCVDQIYNLALTITNDEMWIRFSSILWRYEFPEDLRFSKILEIARKAFCTDNSDNGTMKFMLICLAMTIISYPYDNSFNYIFQDISNPSFKVFFTKYFLILTNFKPYVITFLNEFIRDNNIDLNSIEMANPKLKRIGQKKKNKFFTKLKDLNESIYKKFGKWPAQISCDLPEFIRMDYIDSFDDFSAFKTNIRHNLQLSILQAIQDQSEMNQVTSVYVETYNDIFSGINATKPALEHSIANLSLKPLNLYHKEFAQFLVLSSALKKKNPFSRTLSPLFSPLIHQSLSNFIRRIGLNNQELIVKHADKLEKSLAVSFCTPKSPIPPPESFDSTLKSCKNLILSLSNKIGDPNYNSIIYNAALTGLKMSGKHPLFMTTYFRVLESQIKENPDDFNIQFPYKFLDTFWSVFLLKLIRKYNIKKTSFYSYIHPSIHIALSNEESIPELLKQPIKSIVNIIFGNRTFNSFDFQADVPFVANDKIASICPLTEDEIVLIRSKSGNLYKYRFTNDLLMDYEFVMLSYALNTLFKKFGDCRERGILLPVINSIPLMKSNNDVKYLSKANFLKMSALPECNMKFDTKKDNILWKSLLAENLGALSALQILLHGEFDFSKALVDEKSASIAFKNIIINSPNTKLPILFNNEMINGPFKNGIISAFLCFSYYRAEVEHYLRADYTNEHWDEVLAQFFIPQSSAEIVDAKINELIQQSMSDEAICPVSWF